MFTKTLATGVALGLGLALTSVAAATPASAAVQNVSDAAELETAFRTAEGADNTIVLAAAFTASPDTPVSVPSGVSITLDLNGYDLTVNGAAERAGIGVPGGASLEIIDSTGSTDTHLVVTGGTGGAGIGGDRGSGAGSILLNEIFKVTVHGGAGGAAIGGGQAGGNGTVTIVDTIVYAHGGTAAAGIGSGYHGDAAVTPSGDGCEAIADPDPGHSDPGDSLETMTATFIDADLFVYAGCGTDTVWAAALGGGAGSPGADVLFQGQTEALLVAPGSASALGGGSGAESNFGSFSMVLGGDLNIDEGSTLMVPEGALVTNHGMLWTQGPLINHGTIMNTGGVFALDGIVNHGLVETSYSIVLGGNTDSENHGTIINDAEIAVFDRPLHNYGVIRGEGEVEGIDLILVHNFVNQFDLNGAPDAHVADEQILAASFADAERALPTPPERNGYAFTGWNAAADGSGLSLELETVLGDSPATLTWFAQWQAHAEPGPAPEPAPAPIPDPAPDSGSGAGADSSVPATDPEQPEELVRSGISGPTVLMVSSIAGALILGGIVAGIGILGRKRADGSA